jgi:multicomponent Na+:H+ antiporter subunit D
MTNEAFGWLPQLSPVWLLLIGAASAFLARGWLYRLILLLAPAFALNAALAGTSNTWSADLGVFTLEFGARHPATTIFSVIFTLMVALGTIYAWSKEKGFEIPFAWTYAAAALGVCESGNLITFLFWWEVMAIASTVVVALGGQRASFPAALRYAGVHFMGGALLMAGLAMHAVGGGSMEFSALADTSNAASSLMLLGILVNAGVPLIGSWLPDAYPEASVTGMVFLSAFTTKTTVFVLGQLYPGTAILLPIGVAMIFYGIIYAILENDVRRILAYSIVNQVGFMVCGIGIGTPLALQGAYAHAFAHILYKALLLMAAGAVLYATGKRKCTEVGGLWKTMPLAMICGTIGALAISAFPLTSGFTTKSMITEAAEHSGLGWVWLALVAASAGVFLHAGIKFPYFVFFHRPSHLVPKPVPLTMSLAMVLASVACVLFGVWPEPIYRLLPTLGGEVPGYQAYTLTHVVSQVQLLGCSALAFFALLSMLQRTKTITLDADWLYRRGVHLLNPYLGRGLLDQLDLIRKDLRYVLTDAVVGEPMWLRHARSVNLRDSVTLASAVLAAVVAVGLIWR